MINLELLDELVKRNGVTMYYLASELNLSYPALYYKYTGKRKFTLLEALRLKRILRLTREEWLAVFDPDGESIWE